MIEKYYSLIFLYAGRSKNTSFIFIIAAFFSTNFHFAQPQDDEYVFRTLDKNITQRAISTILQDKEGFIWLGTNGAGLHKYNGMDFISYRKSSDTDNSLQSSLIYSTYLDRSDRLWVGTNVGLNLYDKEVDQFRRVDINLEGSHYDFTSIRTIIDVDQDNLLVGNHEYGAILLNKNNHTTQRLTYNEKTIPSGFVINSSSSIEEKKVLLGSNHGLLTYHPDTKNLTELDFMTRNGIKKVLAPIESIFVDEDNTIWLGTQSDGIVSIKKDKENYYSVKTFPITDKRIFSITQTKKGHILCGTENDGLFQLNTEGTVLKNYRYNKFDKNSIKSNSIWSLYRDNQDRIWIGYYNSGLGVYDQFYDKFQDIESLPNVSNSLQSDFVTAITKDNDGNFWIGMDGGGIDIFDPKHQTFIHLSDPNNAKISGLTALDILAIFIDSNQNVWVGTWNSGIYLLKKNSNYFVNFNNQNTANKIKSNRILSFDEDNDGTIWIGTFQKGLHSYNPNTEEFTHHNSSAFSSLNIENSDIRKVLVDSNDNIWIATYLDLFKITKQKDATFIVSSINDNLPSSNEELSGIHFVQTLYEDSKKNLWIGTDGDGLFQYNLQNNRLNWHKNDAKVNQETVTSIIEDDSGTIWFSGNNGLSNLDVSNNKMTSYTTEDGLLSNNFSNSAVIKEKSGRLYFGGYKGINHFHPGEIFKNENVTPLYFSDFRIFNTSVSPTKKNSPLNKVISETEVLTLSHDQSVFTIEYAGINFTRSEKNEYAYILEGFEKKWNYVGNNRSATYTNLPSGTYTFRVKAANNDGFWNPDPISLQIKVLPPWYKTTAAIFSYFLFLGFIVFITYKLLNERLKQKRLVQYERERRQQEEALNTKKIQFFTNISHEFRTPLTLILNPLEDILQNKIHYIPDQIKEKHKIIYKNTSRLKRLIDELMDFRKLQFKRMKVRASSINAVSFTNEVVSFFEEEAQEKNIMLSVYSDTDEIQVWADPGMLEKIIFNILSNAFKVTPTNGVISIHILKSPKLKLLPLVHETNPVPVLEISIEDTGLGIKKEEVEKIFERFYQAKETNNQYYGGTGIGLEVVRNFIDLHRGKIEVDSKEGEGTTFKIFLALGKKHFDASELFITDLEKSNDHKFLSVGEPANGIKENSGEHRKRKTLLIVEDNVELRNYLKHELKSEYMITEVANGREALEIAYKMMPDVIVSDIMMPEMDGYEFCKKLKQDIKTSHIPILMLTAKTMSEDKIKGMESGADAYVSKPFEMKLLRSQLRQLIKSRQLLFDKYLRNTSNASTTVDTNSLDKEFMTKVITYIHNNLSDMDLNVEQLAEELSLSRSQLYRKIKALTGYTANEFLRKVRLEKAKQMIENNSFSIAEISYKVGFSSPSYFTKCFKTQFGILPTDFVKLNS